MPTLPSASTGENPLWLRTIPGTGVGQVSGVVERLEVALGFECTLAA